MALDDPRYNPERSESKSPNGSSDDESFASNAQEREGKTTNGGGRNEEHRANGANGEADASRFKIPFRSLFSGYPDAYGDFRATGRDQNGKVIGKATTITGKVTIDLYREHLAGKRCRGIIPLTEENECFFAAIDVDTKDENGNPREVDAVAIAKRSDELKLPFVVCRSKSDGAHVYAFFADPQPAEPVREWLASVAEQLGEGGAEIFPKQSARVKPDDIGNWINLPYFGNSRQAVLPNGKTLNLEEFIAYAEDRRQRLTSEAFENYRQAAAERKPSGKPNGHANEGRSSGKRKRSAKQDEGRDGYLFSQACGLLAKDMDPEVVRATIKAMNANATVNEHSHFSQGPLPESEVDKLVDSAIKTHERKHSANVAGSVLGCTDLANGERLVRRHGDDLRYCYAWKAWLYWNGQWWMLDAPAEVCHVCKETARSIYDEAKNANDLDQQRALAKWAGNSQSRRGQEAMEWAARSELDVKTDDFDRDLYLLNVENGTLDLRTGELREHRREDMITKLAPVIYDPNATCPRWLRFLDEVMDGDQEMVGYLQRMVGYALTGETTEHCMFILHGNGRNGKSTFVETLHHMLGDYARKAEMKAFLQKTQDTVNNDIAALRGARLASAVEIGKGRRLNEPLVKEVTGGDRMTARFLHKEFFEFVPEFKLFLAVNDRPEIKGTDEGIWSRVRLVPFDVTFSPEERDKDLGKKLKAELPGILAWAVQGCLEWQRDGLKDPEKVSAATQEYREESDLLGGFIWANCVTGDPKNVYVTTGDFYLKFEQWCKDEGTHPMPNNELSKEMKRRGFPSEQKWLHSRNQKIYRGLGWKAEPGQDSTHYREQEQFF